MHADRATSHAEFSPFSVASSSSAQLVPLLVLFRDGSGRRNSVRCCVLPFLAPPAGGEFRSVARSRWYERNSKDSPRNRQLNDGAPGDAMFPAARGGLAPMREGL